MRAQRVVEALFLIAAFFSEDVRFAYVTLVLAVLQALSPRLVPVAWVAALLWRARAPRPSDLYFDLGGTRGACAISAIMLGAGIALVHAGHVVAGYLFMALPAASFVLSPTVGFCCGCAVYVWGREILARLGIARRVPDGACDVVLDAEEEAPDHPG